MWQAPKKRRIATTTTKLTKALNPQPLSRITKLLLDQIYTIEYTMGTHGSFIFRGYNPYIGGSKP